MQQRPLEWGGGGGVELISGNYSKWDFRGLNAFCVTTILINFFRFMVHFISIKQLLKIVFSLKKILLYLKESFFLRK